MYLCVKVVSFFREKFVKKSMCSNFILLSALVFFKLLIIFAMISAPV